MQDLAIFYLVKADYRLMLGGGSTQASPTDPVSSVRASDLRCRVWDLGLRALGLGFRI